MDEKLIMQALRIMRKRASEYNGYADDREDRYGKDCRLADQYRNIAVGYEFAAVILQEAINGDAEILAIKEGD